MTTALPPSAADISSQRFASFSIIFTPFPLRISSSLKYSAMRLAPSSITCFVRFCSMPMLPSSFCISSGAAIRPSLSPARRTKLPRGMYAVLSRSTAHTRNDAPLFALSAESSTPSSAEPGLTLISAISKRLRVKLSDFTADGNFRMLYMAFAVSLSGLMTIESSS